MSSLFKAKVEISKLIHDWPLWCEAITRASTEVLGLCEVYVFGSVIEGRAAGGSDVDLLIVAKRLPRDFRVRSGLKAEIEELANLPLYHPFEIHLATKEEAEKNPIYREALESGKTKRFVSR